MLEVTILKTVHARREEARKLLPYIIQADVFSPENAGLSREKALENEEIWIQVLGLEITRTRFIARVEEVVRGDRMPEEYIEYLCCANDYIYRNQKPTYFAERWEKPLEGRRVVTSQVQGELFFSHGMYYIS